MTTRIVLGTGLFSPDVTACPAADAVSCPSRNTKAFKFGEEAFAGSYTRTPPSILRPSSTSASSLLSGSLMRTIIVRLSFSSTHVDSKGSRVTVFRLCSAKTPLSGRGCCDLAELDTSACASLPPSTLATLNQKASDKMSANMASGELNLLKIAANASG